MGTIRASLQLMDGMTPIFRSMQKALSIVLDSFESLQKASSKAIDTSNIATAREELNNAAHALDELKENIEESKKSSKELPNHFKEASSAANDLLSRAKSIATTLGAAFAVKKVIELSDELTQTNARLSLIADNGKSVADLQNMIFGAAQRSRGDYQQVADMVSKIGLNAKDAFNSNEEMVAFLLTLSFVFKRLVAHVDEEGYELLAEANNDLANVLDELHNLSVQLRPSALDHLGFVAALRSQAAVFERTYGNEIVFEGSLSCDRFDQALETQAYRICQEAILNACKYSGSEKVIVRLEDSAGWLHVSVIDHGCGFDTEQPEIKGSGCGLVGMQERASVIGARLAMESDEHGTKMTLVAPMHVAEGKEAGA